MRVAVRPDLQHMGYGSRAVEQPPVLPSELSDPAARLPPSGGASKKAKAAAAAAAAAAAEEEAARPFPTEDRAARAAAAAPARAAPAGRSTG